MTHGITFVQKAKKWLFYVCYNTENRQDIFTWCDSEEDALLKKKEYEQVWKPTKCF